MDEKDAKIARFRVLFVLLSFLRFSCGKVASFMHSVHYCQAFKDCVMKKMSAILAGPNEIEEKEGSELFCKFYNRAEKNIGFAGKIGCQVFSGG